jgi:transcription initiation factor IIE alpha subunit
MPTIEEVKERIMGLVTLAAMQKVRPITIEKTIAEEKGISMREVREALTALTREDRLVYTYRDPCSYVELPAGARPGRA